MLPYVHFNTASIPVVLLVIDSSAQWHFFALETIVCAGKIVLRACFRSSFLYGGLYYLSRGRSAAIGRSAVTGIHSIQDLI